MKKTLLFALIGLVFYTACTRISTTEIGTGLIPAVDGVNTFDTTFDVYTDNVPVDSIRISKYQEHALGYTNDPIFGTTRAIINLEIKPQYYPYNFEVREDSLTLDSAVLVLKYIAAWGDTTMPISFNVFELANKMKADSVYPSYTSLATSGPQLNTPKSFDIRKLDKADTLKAYKESSAYQIRIPLTAAFGNKLLHTFDTGTTGHIDAYRSDSLFSERFHGFSIIPNTSSNALLRINLQDTNTKVALYYHYLNRTGNNNKDTTVRYFRAGGFTAGTSNNIVRNRNGYDANATTAANSATTVVDGKTIANDSIVYLQSGPGHHVRVKVPHLADMSNRVVHRAELYMEQVAGNSVTDNMFIASNLFLTSYSADSNRLFHIPNEISYSSDGTVGNISTFGGYVVFKNDAVGNRVATYAFNVSRYVQGLITRKETAYDFNLFAPVHDYVYTSPTSGLLYPIYTDQLNPPGIGRVRLGGGSSKLHKMKLRVIYSKL